MKYFYFLLVILFLVSCNKKSETNKTKNGNTPKDGETILIKKPIDPNFEINLKKKFRINYSELGCNLPFDINQDVNGNIYLVDIQKARILAYNKEGKYLKAIGRRGKGPGEFTSLNSVAISKDTLFATNQGSHKISLFDCRDTSYTFIKELPANSLQFLKAYGKNFLAYKQSSDSKTQKAIFSVTMFDRKFKEIKDLSSKSVKFSEFANPNLDFVMFIPIFTANQDYAFITETSRDKYLISAYDTAGKLIYKIKRPFMKIPINKKELAEFNEFVKNNDKSGSIPELKAENKLAILSLHLDAKNRLWVQKSVNREREGFKNNSFYFDIYEKGKLLNTVHFLNITGRDLWDLQQRIFIKDETLFYLNGAEGFVDVYEIEN